MLLGTSEFLRSCFPNVRFLVDNFWVAELRQSSVSDFTGLYKRKHNCQYQPLKFSTEALCVVAQASDTSTEETGSL